MENDHTSCGDKKDSKKDLDPELEELLDDALTDFDKPLAQPSNTPLLAASKPPATVSALPVTTAAPKGEEPAQKKDELGDQEMITQFENAIKAFFDETQMKSEFEKIAHSEMSGSEDEFSASLAETLKNLAEKTQQLSDQPTEEELNRLLNLEDPLAAESEMSQFLPIMQSVVQNLLSKELLYPALKDIIEKYPAWLEEKQSTLPAEEYQRYSSQYDYMKQVCVEYESEAPNDSEPEKKARFSKILQLMQKMQECGHPPKEIIGDSPSPLEFGQDGIPKLPGDKCCVM